MFSNPKEGIIDGVHWFAAQDAEDPRLLHMTFHDENLNNVYYTFEYFHSQNQVIDVANYVREYKKWLESRMIPEKTSEGN